MKSPSPPAAPDPVATSQAQAAANKEAVLESAKVNQINEVTPYGSLTYTGDVGSPDRTRITSLSPEAQRQFDQQAELANLLGQSAIDVGKSIDYTPFSLSDLPSTDSYEKAAYERAVGLMRPDWEREDKALQQRLANQGLPVGSEAYTGAWDPVYRGRDQVRTAAAFDAMNAGRAMRGQDINERLLERTQPMNELAALLQGAPALGSPNFGSTAQYQMSPADVQGAYSTQYQGQLNNYNQKMGAHNSAMGGLAGLGGTAMTLAAPYLMAAI